MKQVLCFDVVLKLFQSNTSIAIMIEFIDHHHSHFANEWDLL